MKQYVVRMNILPIFIFRIINIVLITFEYMRYKRYSSNNINAGTDFKKSHYYLPSYNISDSVILIRL